MSKIRFDTKEVEKNGRKYLDIYAVIDGKKFRLEPCGFYSVKQKNYFYWLLNNQVLPK